MSRLNAKHLARVNQQLSGRPSGAPHGCVQLAGATFPAEVTENPAALVHEPSPCPAAQCSTCGGHDLFVGHSRRLPPLFPLLWWDAEERQEGGTTV